MERIFGICSDIHGNWEALEAVLKDMTAHGVTQKICLGDVVGYGADPDRCVAEVKENGWLTLTGNHDEALVFPEMLEYFNPLAVAGVLWAKAQLDRAEVEWLAGLPHVMRGSDYELVHASMDAPLDWNYIMDRSDAARHFEQQKKLVCFCGHTHRAMIWRQGRRIYPKQPTSRKFTLPRKQKVLLNVGSVGQPRDGNTKASYVLYWPEARTVQFRRVRYDWETTQNKIYDAGLPEKLGRRLSLGV